MLHQTLGQHVIGFIGEIMREAAIACRFVQFALRAHVIGYVRNDDEGSESFLGALDKDAVVMILGIGGIDDKDAFVG